MEIKSFNFPTFEEWYESDCEYSDAIGDYHVRIATTSWSKDKMIFRAAISTHENPLNVWVKVVKDSQVSVHADAKDPNYKEKLKEWYEKTCQILNRVFTVYIKENYLENGGK
jgi:acylphosphatase